MADVGCRMSDLQLHSSDFSLLSSVSLVVLPSDFCLFSVSCLLSPVFRSPDLHSLKVCVTFPVDHLQFERVQRREGFQMVKRTRIKPGSETKPRAAHRHSPKDTAVESSVSEKAKKAFDIDIFRGWCKSCGICAAFCPRECIGKDEEGSPVVKDANRCSGCGWCEVHCPDFAISVRQRNLNPVQPEED